MPYDCNSLCTILYYTIIIQLRLDACGENRCFERAVLSHIYSLGFRFLENILQANRGKIWFIKSSCSVVYKVGVNNKSALFGTRFKSNAYNITGIYFLRLCSFVGCPEIYIIFLQSKVFELLKFFFSCFICNFSTIPKDYYLTHRDGYLISVRID